MTKYFSNAAVAINALISAACATASGNPSSAEPATQTMPQRSEATLQALLVKYDAAAPAVRMQLEQQIDQAAGQRYATVARLYWHTDLAAAQAESRARGKPILSLRMLGRLDEELSCTNSRFFRVVLYPDPTVNEYLRKNFVLHWSTERPVPVMTIDMGDGRKIVRTTTGNSAHYVLDAQGRPIDVLPGLYAPREFVAGLQQAVAIELRVRGLAERERNASIVSFHQLAYNAQLARWKKVKVVKAPPTNGGLAVAADMDNFLSKAQMATMGKLAVEGPDLQQIKLGPDPLQVAENQDFWRLAGQGLFGYGVSFLTEKVEGRDFERKGPHLLSPESKTLFLQLFNQPGDLKGSIDLDGVRMNYFDGLLVADTAQNEFVLHQKIHQLFMTAPDYCANFNQLNSWIYNLVFSTPPGDSWMGLVNEVSFVALPKAGIVVGGSTGH
jgi:hypothetical protein